MSDETPDVPPGYEPLTRVSPFVERIGPLYARRRDTGVVFGFRALAHHANTYGVVHGGMLMSFADEAIGAAVWHAVGKRRCTTVSLSTDFVSSGRVGDWIEADVETTRQGRSMIFMRGRLHCDGRTILSVNGIWKLLEKG
ncbi:PaaI family thioesterase [Oceanibacterium hippocampi]|uniref:Thioesterase superfamily protein n=1 Tax=Oceanibacterium hippocampi TaxID=745714 RepID=A0A1Y5S1I9_9PROT|nr:PaaI family thioesterase [Oceanibacterium hippocampi]SLN29514.1 Thioesterase superfamily protein [Oceanibacterium hippocampi]